MAKLYVTNRYVVCHACEKVIDRDEFKDTMRNGAYYHFDCVPGPLTIPEMFLSTPFMIHLLKSFRELTKEIDRGV